MTDSMRDQIGLGVIGCASVAARRMLPAIREVPAVRLVAVASRSAEKAAQFATRFGCEAITGYQNLLDRPDVDAVYVPLPPGLHHRWISLALEAGKHVLAEKPLAMTRHDAVELVDLAVRKGRLLMENFAFVHHSQHATVQALVMQGAIGEPRSFSSSFGFPPLGSDNFRYRAELGGGALLDAGVYPIRAAQLLLGPDLEVCGACLRYDDQTGVDVAGGALLRTSRGVPVHLSFGFEHAYQSTYTLWGSLGELTADRAFTPPPDLRPALHVTRMDLHKELTVPPGNQFARICEQFARSVLDGHGFDQAYIDIVRQATLVDAVREIAQRVVC